MRPEVGRWSHQHPLSVGPLLKADESKKSKRGVSEFPNGCRKGCPSLSRQGFFGFFGSPTRAHVRGGKSGETP